MAIKDIGEIILAWCRGHKVICNCCECENVRSRLKLRYIPSKCSVTGKRIVFISHGPDWDLWLIYRDADGVWRSNTPDSMSMANFLNSVTIVKKGE